MHKNCKVSIRPKFWVTWCSIKYNTQYSVLSMLKCGVILFTQPHLAVRFAWHWHFVVTNFTVHTITSRPLHTLTPSTLHHMVVLLLVYTIELIWATIRVLIGLKYWVGLVLFIAIVNLFVGRSTGAVCISGVGSTGAQGAGAPPNLKLPYLLAP